MNRSWSATFLLVTWAFLLLAAGGTQASNEEDAIRQALDTYLKAFNNNDAAALSKLWAEDGEHTDDTGETYKGRVEIRAAFQEFFSENSGVKLKLDVSKVKVSSPTKAVVHGASIVSIPGHEDDRSDFATDMVRDDNDWLFVSVGEAAVSPNDINLKELEALIGEWTGQGSEGELELVSQWAADKSFITSHVSIVAVAEDIDLEGTQIIGWDPLEKRITAWMFDSSGGYATGIWSKEGSGWQVKVSRVLNDGTKGSEVHTYESGKDALVWKASSRVVQGDKLADIGPIEAIRRQAETN